MLFLKLLLPLSVLALSYSWTQLLLAATLPQDEVDVLNQIAQTMGARNWTFNADVCEENSCFTGLPGTLPPQLVHLPYLQEISIFGNRLSGNIPDQLGNITSLTYL
ncbi:hypothetical protein Patl1_10418 [Pistacia atlantica]|uniref:Uncharacterized protein n=1 Tax=Pistacia atlantica TaxID=434234 RepID=A0ACC1A9U1_9ROSI|nr:hypothetical protein Patl1_10418 [Pistacia atlantica]